MPYYGDGAPYYYGSSGPFANHSSIMSSIGRYHNPIAARYSPHLSTISETPFVKLRRYSPAVPSSAATSSLQPRPRRVIDTADIDVSKPPSSRSQLDDHHRHQRHRLRRDRPTIKIRSQALKDNPALREYNERHEKTVGEMLVEKFLIKDKNAAAPSAPRIKLYHQPSLVARDAEKERENDILAAIRHRITRKMTRRRSSVDAIPLDPEQIEREAALQAAQAVALDTLVAEELAEAEMEVRKGTFTKRHSLVVPTPMPMEISEDEESEEETVRKHVAAKKKRRRKSMDKYSQSEEDEEEDTFSIAESIIEEEEFEWDDRDKCDDLKKIMPSIKVPPEQKRAVSPRMERKEKLDEVGNRLKELRKEVRKLDKKDRDIKQDLTSKDGKMKEIVKPKVERVKKDVIEPKLDESKVDVVEAELDKVKEEKVVTEIKAEKDAAVPNKIDIVESKVEELKKEEVPEKTKVEELKKEAVPEKITTEIIKPKVEKLKKEAVPEKITTEIVKPKVEELKKEVVPEKIATEIIKLKVEELKKETVPEKITTEIIKPKVEKLKTAAIPDKIVTEKVAPKKETTKPKKELEAKQTETPKKDVVVVEETKKVDDKNLRSNDASEAAKSQDVTKGKDEESKLHKDDTTAETNDAEPSAKISKDETKPLKPKERKQQQLKEKSPKLKRTTSAPQQLPPEPQSPCFKIEACNSVGDFSTLYVKSAEAAATRSNIEQFRESIRLPAPKARTSSIETTEVVLPVRRPYVRDTSRNSVYLALKPMRKEEAADAKIISEEGEEIDDDQQQQISGDRQVDDEKSSSQPAARRADDEEVVAAWWDETPAEEKKIEEKVETVVDKKTEVEKKIATSKTVAEKPVEAAKVEEKVDVKVAAEKPVEAVKIVEKVAVKVAVVDKKVEKKTEVKPTPVVDKKIATSKSAEKPVEAVKIEEVKPDSKVKVDKKATQEVRANDTSVATEKPSDISASKAQLDVDKSVAAEKKAKAVVAEKATKPSTPTSLAAVDTQKKSEALPTVHDDDDKTITPACNDDADDNNKSSSLDDYGESDVTRIAPEETKKSTIIAAAKRDERKRKVDAQAIMKIEKRILEEAESPDKILTAALPSALDEKNDDEAAAKKSGTEIDFWNEKIDESLQRDAAVESQPQQQNNLRLDLTRIDDDAKKDDDLQTPLIQDQQTTPLVDEPATPLAENLSEVPAANLRLTEDERRSTVKYNGATTKEDEQQQQQLSGTVKKISKWGNHDNLASIDSNVTASPAASSTTTKKKIVKKKKSSTTAKKTGEGATTKKTGESAKKTKTPVTKKAAAAATPTQLKSSAAGMSASGSPAQRPADLNKLFYTTPAILLTATPRDLRKVRRAKAKKKKPPPTRTPSLSSDSTGSTRSTATTSTEEGSNCEEDAEQKRLNSTRSNDSGFDGSPRLSNCDMVCHKKCEKLTGNLCGLNQKLVAEALQALKKGPVYTRHGRKSFVRRRLRPYLGYYGCVDDYEQLPPTQTPSQSSDNQRNAEGDHFHHSGRITPPATNLPRFKKYEVTDFNFLKVLGKGSFGKVLLAELRGTECVYAVKCLKKDVVLEDDDVECTLIERKVLTLATRHPYLCHLFCTFQTESHLFFVMEYLNGGDLMFHIQKSGRFSEARAKFYAAEIWSGLIFLHKKGIVYRDLKLDNVLLDFEGHIRIADFGMCKLQIFLDRTADTFCGTPDYMAPEIIKGLKYNQAVDWWSFGVLLYEMLTGQSPFSGCDEDELFWSICNERPFIPRYLSQSSTDILVCLLEKDAGKRIPGHEIACHTFFCNISWEKLERRALEPPFKPAVEHTLDTRYFDTAFTAERPRLTPVPEEILTSMDQAVFRGFSYTNPNATD